MKFTVSDKRKNKLKFTAYIVVFLIAIVLLFLPANFFDEGESLCLSVQFFGLECYACGMTRAIQHLIHLDFEAAYGFNKLSFIVLPLLSFMLMKDFISLVKEIRK